MITDFFLDLFSSGAETVVGKLPEATTNPDVSGLGTWLADINYFLPLGEVASAVLTVIALGPAFVVATLANWLVIGVLRGGSPRA